jgi:hypothetical protein
VPEVAGARQLRPLLHPMAASDRFFRDAVPGLER